MFLFFEMVRNFKNIFALRDKMQVPKIGEHVTVTDSQGFPHKYTVQGYQNIYIAPIEIISPYPDEITLLEYRNGWKVHDSDIAFHIKIFEPIVVSSDQKHGSLVEISQDGQNKTYYHVVKLPQIQVYDHESKKESILSNYSNMLPKNFCNFSNFPNKFDINKNPITALNLWLACHEFNLSLTDGYDFWNNLLNLLESELQLDTSSEWIRENPRKFISKADIALTKLCSTDRYFESNQTNFIQMLITGGCNCRCGTQILWSLAEVYGIDDLIGAAYWDDHINLIYIPNQNTDLGSVEFYETTNLDSSDWKPLNFFENRKLLRFGFSREDRIFEFLLSMIQYVLEYKLEPETSVKTMFEELFDNTPDNFWNTLPFLKSLKMGQAEDFEALITEPVFDTGTLMSRFLVYSYADQDIYRSLVFEVMLNKLRNIIDKTPLTNIEKTLNYINYEIMVPVSSKNLISIKLRLDKTWV